jgi:hypothetical protein
MISSKARHSGQGGIVCLSDVGAAIGSAELSRCTESGKLSFVEFNFLRNRRKLHRLAAQQWLLRGEKQRQR